MAHNVVRFPAVSSTSILSLPDTEAGHSSGLTRQQTASEICKLIYSASPTTTQHLDDFYEPNAVYENPLFTASSRAVISDIHSLATRFNQLDVPRPAAVLYALFNLKTDIWTDPWFHALRIWSEIGDISESESFDGQRKVTVEHTLHVLFLPSLHRSGQRNTGSAPDQASSADRSLSFPSSALQRKATDSTLGMDLSLPSPLHLQLPVISRLSFNDADKITYHRDLWDVKDLLGLVPGMTIAQWIGGRLVAQGLRSAAWISRAILGSHISQHSTDLVEAPRDEEAGITPASAYAIAVNAGRSHTPPSSLAEL